MPDQLRVYRRIIDLALEIIHLTHFHEEQLILAEQLLAALLKLEDAEELGIPVLLFADTIEGGGIPGPKELLGLRDLLLARAFERARDLGIDFDWSLDLDDAEVAIRAIRLKVVTLAKERTGDPERALAFLRLLDEASETGVPNPQELATASQAFFESVRVSVEESDLTILEPERRN